MNENGIPWNKHLDGRLDIAVAYLLDAEKLFEADKLLRANLRNEEVVANLAVHYVKDAIFTLKSLQSDVWGNQTDRA